MVAPVSRLAVVAGKVMGGSLLALIQGTLFLLLAPLVGISFSPASFFLALFTIALISLSLSALGFLFAWKLDSVQGFHGIMNLVLMPMWLLSGSFFPLEKAPVWIRPIMYLNPLTYGLSSLKLALYQGSESVGSGFPFVLSRVVSGGVGLVFYALAYLAVSRGKESFA